MRITPNNIGILIFITILLIGIQVILIMLICRNFGKQLKREIIVLCIVQFFFQTGFLMRVIIEYDFLSRVKHEQNNEDPKGWKERYKFFYHILPVFYEALPILMVYLHHIKNFRERAAPPIDTNQTNTGTGDTRTRSTTETKEGNGDNNNKDRGIFSPNTKTKRGSNV